MGSYWILMELEICYNSIILSEDSVDSRVQYAYYADTEYQVKNLNWLVSE